MLNITLEESDCFASWMVAEDVPSLPMQDPKKGKYVRVFRTLF